MLSPVEFTRTWEPVCYAFRVEKKVRKFTSHIDAATADREFYQKLSPDERLKIFLELLNYAPEQRLERVYRVTKLSRS